MGNQDQRLKRIIQTLKINTASTIQDLAEELSVSHMTVRRDLEVLTEQNIVRLIYGGVVLNTSVFEGTEEKKYSLVDAGSRNPEAKMRIGRKAASMIEENDIIIIDSGSTTEYAAKYLPDDTMATILCYALNVLLEVAQKNSSKLLFAGGTFHPNTLMFESPEGIELINRIRARKAFISASGIDGKLGVTCANDYEGETKRAIIHSSQRKILLADSSKFGNIASDYFAELSEFDEIITDQTIPEEYVTILKDLGIQLHLV
jgi:DeoR family deoxyribose operon repressor